MPNSVAVSPDDAVIKSDQTKPTQTLLRGTEDWAPPRPQLILTMQQGAKLV